MKSLIALALLMSTAPSQQAAVFVGTGDWSELPALEGRGYDHLHPNVTARLYEIAKERKCELPGQGYQQLNFRMSFAAQFEPNGSLKQVVIPRLDCPEAEAILGGAVVEMIRGGDYRADGTSPEGWYQGVLRFGMAG